jgi:fructokinase
MTMLFGSVEAGGTKFVCALGSGPDDLRERVVIETRDPGPTIERVIDQLRPHRDRLAAIGLAAFGPIVLDRDSDRYGRLGATPKQGWEGTDLVGPLAALGVPVGLDTDVNAAALAERRWGAAQGLDSVVYVTAGTGIGGGALVGGEPVHGLVHPEMGHIRIPRHPRDPLERGACPFHHDCWEGWAAGPAIELRWGSGVRATDLDDADALGLLAYYLAAGVVNIVLTFSPQRVIFGGGIVLGSANTTHTDRLLGLVRRETLSLLGGYIQADAVLKQIDEYLVPAKLGADAGVLGGIVLAQREVARSGDLAPG